MTSICKAYGANGALAGPQSGPSIRQDEHEPQQEETVDPRDALVGRWVLASQPREEGTGTTKKRERAAPWFIRELLVDLHYNADGDLIIHIQACVGVSFVSRWVDNGFAKVDESGVFRCVHTPDNAHNEFRLLSQRNRAECLYFVDGVPQPSKLVRLERQKTF